MLKEKSATGGRAGRPSEFYCKVSGMGGLRRGGLRLLAQRRKSGGVVDSQIGQDLASQINTGFLQTMDELAVAGAIQLGRGADAHDPDGAVLPLLLLAAAVGELQAALDRLFGRTVEFGFC